MINHWNWTNTNFIKIQILIPWKFQPRLKLNFHQLEAPKISLKYRKRSLCFPGRNKKITSTFSQWNTWMCFNVIFDGLGSHGMNIRHQIPPFGRIFYGELFPHIEVSQIQKKNLLMDPIKRGSSTHGFVTVTIFRHFSQWVKKVTPFVSSLPGARWKSTLDAAYCVVTKWSPMGRWVFSESSHGVRWGRITCQEILGGTIKSYPQIWEGKPSKLPILEGIKQYNNANVWIIICSFWRDFQDFP